MKNILIIFAITIIFTSVPYSFSQIAEPETCSDILTDAEILAITNLVDHTFTQREPSNPESLFSGLSMQCMYSLEPHVYDPDKDDQIFSIETNVMIFDSVQSAQSHLEMLKNTMTNIEDKVVTVESDDWTLRTLNLFDAELGVPRPSIVDHYVQITAVQDNLLVSLGTVVKGDRSLADENALRKILMKIDHNLSNAENSSEIIEPAMVTNEPVMTEKNNEPADNGGGGCLIATAAYGTELAPQVQFLREIRDNTVMSTSSGIAFMTGFNQLYYSFSPTIADLERENPMFQQVVRAFITPMISTLSIMTLADDSSEMEVLGLGISVIALNLGMYVAAPAFVGFKVNKHIQSRK